MTSTLRCQRRGCGTVMVERHDKTLGRIALVCEPCERNRAGHCRECQAPLPTPKHMRCEACGARVHKKKQALATKNRRKAPGGLAHEAKLKRRRYKQNRNVRDKTLSANKAWRQANPRKRDDADRLYFRTWAKNDRARKRAAGQQSEVAA